MARELKNILAIGRGFWDAQVLITAVRHGIFDVLVKSGTAADVASSRGLDARAAAMLLDACASLGLLDKKNNRYTLKPGVRPYLTSGSPDNVLSILKHFDHMYESWSKLADSVATGKPAIRKNPIAGTDDQAYHFIKGMDNLTRFYKDRVVDAINLTGATKVMDIGSGPATYLREMLSRKPGLKGYILDFPAATAVAREFLKKDGFLKRVTFFEGDLEKTACGSGYDVVIISQVLHSLSDTGKRNAVKKAFDILKKGGRLYIHEFYMNETRTGPKDNVIFCLNMLLHAPGGDNVTPRQIHSLLASAGFRAGKTVRFTRPDLVLVEGVKQ